MESGTAIGPACVSVFVRTVTIELSDILGMLVHRETVRIKLVGAGLRSKVTVMARKCCRGRYRFERWLFLSAFFFSCLFLSVRCVSQWLSGETG